MLLTKPTSCETVPPMKKLLLSLSVLFFTVPASATVTVDKSSTTYVCSGAATYAIDFPFLEKSHIVVTRWATATPAVVTTLVQNGASDPSYTVTMYGGGSSGLVTLTNGTTCVTNYTLKVSRVVPITQTISFRTQGTFRPRSHEYMGDKLTMIIQQLDDGIAASSESTDLINDHIGSDDDHANYFYLPGRSGGQTGKGGLLDGEELTLYGSAAGVVTYGFINFYGGTATATLGNTNGGDPSFDLDGDLNIAAAHFLDTPEARSTVYYGNGTADIKGDHDGSNGTVTIGKSDEIYVDEANSYVGINDAAPDVELSIDGTTRIQHGLHVVGSGETTYLEAGEAVVVDSGDVRIDEDLTVVGVIYGSRDASGTLYLASTYNGTKGDVFIGNSVFIEEDEQEVGINDTTPSYDLDVLGDIRSTASLYVGTTSGKLGVGTTSPDATLDVRGTITGRVKQGTFSPSYTLVDTTDCGSVLTSSTNGDELTLPDRDTDNDGCMVTYINTGTTGAVQITINPTANNGIYGSCEGVAFAGTSGYKAQNTLATQEKGDRITLVATNSKAWWITECEGVWALVAP